LLYPSAHGRKSYSKFPLSIYLGGPERRSLPEEKLAYDGNSIDYQLSVMDVSDITAAHIHSGNVGKNGPVIVTLFESDTPTDQTNGVLSEGTISAADLEGPMDGRDIRLSICNG
jgi:hypothetical protein